MWLRKLFDSVVRSALYFGSFNPPHIGHEGILRYLKECGDFDDICVVLSPQNPLKDKRLLLDEGERCKMVKAWIGTLPFVRCSTIEFEMEKPSYTYLTMRRFRLEQPEQLLIAHTVTTFHRTMEKKMHL